MASLPSLLYSPALALTLLALLTSSTHSHRCTSRNLANNKLYTNCVDLPTLDACLRYSYNATNSSLSVAFTAPPAKPDGWVSWAVNPLGWGMEGSQAFVALTIDGSIMVKTFDILSYEELEESKLSFETWDVSAESNSSTKDYTIFASFKVPSERLNHLWQVGPSVTQGVPDTHEFEEDNLQSTGTLDLAATSHIEHSNTNVVANSPMATPPTGATANSPTAAPPPTNGCNNAVAEIGICYGLIVLLSASFIGF